MTDKLHPKLGELNRLFKEIQQYKADHPSEKVGYYANNTGSILNAYREGDLNFEEAIKALESRSNPAPVDLWETLRLAITEDKTLWEFPVTDGGAARLCDAMDAAIIEHIADIAASVAAAHFANDGVALDKAKLRNRLLSQIDRNTKVAVLQRQDQNIEGARQADIIRFENQVLLAGLDRGDFDAATLAPGDGQDGALKWQKELPTDEGWYWRLDPELGITDCVKLVKTIRSTHPGKWRWLTINGPIDILTGYRFARIPEPQESDDGR